MTITVPRPNADEFAPFYASYIAQVPDGADAIHGLITQRERVTNLLSAVSETEAGFRYTPDKWSIKEVVGHMADAERVFAYRLLRISRADGTPLPGFDEKAYVHMSGFDDRSLVDLASDWVAVRNATVSLARGVDATMWAHRGLANGHTVSARALLYIMLGHVAHHCHVLHERYGLALPGGAPCI